MCYTCFYDVLVMCSGCFRDVLVMFEFSIGGFSWRLNSSQSMCPCRHPFSNSAYVTQVVIIQCLLLVVTAGRPNDFVPNVANAIYCFSLSDELAVPADHASKLRHMHTPANALVPQLCRLDSRVTYGLSLIKCVSSRKTVQGGRFQQIYPERSNLQTQSNGTENWPFACLSERSNNNSV